MRLEADVKALENTSPKAWLAVIAVALAIFAVVSAEMLPIGLLTPIAQSMAQSVGRSSLIISVPSFVAAVTAPSVVLLFKGMNRRSLLLFFMLLLLCSNLLAAVVSDFHWLLLARVCFGISMGGIWCLAGGLALRLVADQHVALATSIIFSGVAAASVLGVPIGVYLGDLWGWRQAFVCVAVLVAGVLALLFWSLPSLPANSDISLKSTLHTLARSKIVLGLALTLLLVTGHFTAYTFVRPVLQSIALFSDHSIGALLLFYGVCGIVGNFIAGFNLQKRLHATIIAIALGMAVATILFVPWGDSQAISVALLLLWGLAYGGVSVSLMTWMIRAAPDRVEIASAANIAIFNLSIGSGAYIGGVLFDGFGVLSNLIFACVLSVAAAILVATTSKMQRMRT
ncbi:MFS transporter [Acinetobacter larvae]|uniref:Major facilitator superfamily (MFS) profile domain-containing protein n=1 Tax=Acinetobacter larvae TaxID=1789224 RepID=A0A1B2M0A2_9GAMM|nr:MFS transporter [Acinetobacter larvae]AOA58608.1 hypothetical protein BFG52_09755 [Acinetobacter larvae]